MSDPRPPLRPFSRGTVRAQTADEASAFDRRSIDRVGIPQPVLMENAGRSAAQVVDALYGRGRRSRGTRSVVALVGPGNNGGDALVAARSLAAWGWDARAVLVADREADDPLLHGWPVEVTTDANGVALDRALRDADVVIDGVLGTGVRGVPRERQAGVIQRANGSGTPIVALDVPSGVDASTGAVPGPTIDAELTISFGAPKLGALLHPARAHVGRHVTVEIGFPPLGAEEASAVVVTPAWARAQTPRRDTDTHKNRVGRVVVVGGAMGGAAILAARAAFRAGAGLVQIVCAGADREAVLSAVPEAICVAAGDPAGFEAALDAADSVVVGPGLGTSEEAAELLRRVAGRGGAPLLVDADGLNLAATGALDLATVAADRPLLLTPHPGEMARLVPGAEGSPPAETARAAAEGFGCTVLLKGSPSLTASPGAPLAVDTQSSSDLAVAGMGDTLAGACAALLAQGLAPGPAASVGLYLSGRAAVLAARGTGLTPSDVAESLPDALAETADAVTDLELPFVVFDADPAR